MNHDLKTLLYLRLLILFLCISLSACSLTNSDAAAIVLISPSPSPTATIATPGATSPSSPAVPIQSASTSLSSQPPAIQQPPNPVDIIQGAIVITPSTDLDGGWFGVITGQQVVIQWRNAPTTGIAHVQFSITPTGTGSSESLQLIGTDSDARDGWSTIWQVPSSSITAHIQAQAYSTQNVRLSSSPLIQIYSNDTGTVPTAPPTPVTPVLSTPPTPTGLLATPAPESIPGGASIDYFTVSATSVSWSQLASMCAFTTVRWSISNRPDGTNIVFEQMIDHREGANIELPRQDSFTPSTGEGVVSLQVVPQETTELRLRLRLVRHENYIPITLLEKYISLPISSTGTGGCANIRSFTTTSSGVFRQAMANGTERVSVSWDVANRPPNSNIAFQQVFVDGRITNIELPRADLIVPSEGSGIVAPRFPGSRPLAHITLRLAVIDLSSGIMSAFYDIVVPIIGDLAPTDHPGFVGTPTTDSDQISPAVGQGLLSVSPTLQLGRDTTSWQLYFDQETTIQWNDIPAISLPLAFIRFYALSYEPPASFQQPARRLIGEDQNPFDGISIVWQGSYSNWFGFHALLAEGYDSQNNLLVTSPALSVVLSYQSIIETQIVDTSQCYLSPFPDTVMFSIGASGITTMTAEAVGTVLRSITGDRVIDGNDGNPNRLSAGQRFTVVEGPYCYVRTTTVMPTGISTSVSDRQWRIRLESGIEGWISEYLPDSYVHGNYVPLIELTN